MHTKNPCLDKNYVPHIYFFPPPKVLQNHFRRCFVYFPASEGPKKPLPPLPELRIELRNHQKAAIRWMLDAEIEVKQWLGYMALTDTIRVFIPDEGGMFKEGGVRLPVFRNPYP